MRLRLVREYDPVSDRTTWHVERRKWLLWDRISVRYDRQKDAEDLFYRLKNEGYKLTSKVVEQL